MILHLLENKIKFKGVILVMLFMLLQVGEVKGQKYWIGLSTNWDASSNWFPAGVPTSADDVVIGDDVFFTGSYGPTISDWSSREIKSLAIGGGSKDVTFFMSCYKMRVNGNVTVSSRGTLNNNGTIASYGGNFIVEGKYLESAYAANNGNNVNNKYWATSELTGIDVKIKFPASLSTAGTSFGDLSISGSVTLVGNLFVSAKVAYKHNTSSEIINVDQPRLNVKSGGSLNPEGFKVTFQSGTLSGTTLNPVFSAEPNGMIQVKAGTFNENYDRFFTSYYATSVVDYAASAINQLVDQRFLYPILQISGDKVKSLGGNTKIYAGSADTELRVLAGTLDLKTFTLNRSVTTAYPDFVTGGKLTVSNVGTVLIGNTDGANNFPTGFSTIVLSPENTSNTGSIIDYNGGDQIVANQNYGNLRISGVGIKKLMLPATIQSNLYIDAATLDIAENTLNRTTTGGAMKVSNGATLRLSGSSNFPTNYSTVTLESSASSSLASSTVEYYRVGAQTVANHTYGNLFVTREGEKTILGSNLRLQVEGLLKLENAGGTQNEVILQTGNTNTIILGTNQGRISEVEIAYVTGTVETTKTLGVISPLADGYINSFGDIGITVKSPIDMGSVKIIRKTGPLAIVGNGNNVHRVFEVIPPTGYNTANKAVITLSYFDHENASPDDKLLAYWSDTNPTTSWWRTINPFEANPAQNTVTISNVTPHRFFTLGRGATPFPVEMISFTAAKKGADAVLNWAVAQEQNNSGFEIQASTDGKDYQKIGFVASKVGTSSIKQEYSFTDTRSNKYGIVYYRLKQLDLDGKATLFGPREVNFGKVTVASVTAHPNPIEEALNVVVTTPQASKAEMVIHDMMGKIWLTKDQQVEAGRTELGLNLTNDMPAGIYILTLKLNEGVQTCKLVKE